jgi:hypothetical protein
MSGVQGVGAGGIADVEGTSKVEHGADEGASKGVAVMDGSINVSLGVNELLDLDWRPCNSFSTIISSLSLISFNIPQISLYVMPLS